MAAQRMPGLQAAWGIRIRARQVTIQQQPVLTWIKPARQSRTDLT